MDSRRTTMELTQRCCLTCGSPFMDVDGRRGRPRLFCCERCRRDYAARAAVARGAVCGVDGCGLPAHAFGYCNKHMKRWQRYGDPLGGAEERPRLPVEYRSCPVCGKRFRLPREHRGIEATYCSRVCAAKAMLKERVCESCGRVFTTTTGYDARFCSEECWIAARTATCVVCGQAYVKRANRVTCSRPCRQIRTVDLQNERRGVPPVNRGDRLCKQCGATFTRPFGKAGPRCFCSERCSRKWEQAHSPSRVGRNHRQRARRFAVEYEPLDRIVVFDRSGWTCGICGKHIDRALTWPHPMSVSLDHVVPLSLGGGHTYGNTQAAHLGCNIRKGTQAAEVQLCLIGGGRHQN